MLYALCPLLTREESCMTAKNKDIVIVGIGLMGASLALALRKAYRSYRIVGLLRNRAKIAKAKKQGFIDWGTTSAQKAFAHAHLIVIATPVGSIPAHLAAAEQYAPCGTVVTDMGSTKEKLIAWAEKVRLENIRYVGSHPLAGSHKSGMDAAVKGLYKNAVCFVTPTTATDDAACKEVIQLWRRVGAQVVIVPAAFHDTLLAATSHVPHLVAFAMMGTLMRTMPEAFASVGSGFKDMTRLAASHSALWYDIFLSNRRNVIRSTQQLIGELRYLMRMLGRNDKKRLIAYFEQMKEKREAIDK